MRTLQDQIVANKIGHTGHLNAVARKVATMEQIKDQLDRLYARQNWPAVARKEKELAKIERSIPAGAR